MTPLTTHANRGDNAGRIRPLHRSRAPATTIGLRRSVHVPERNYAEFEPGNVTFSVYMPEKMGMEFHANTNHYALHVEDVAAARAELESRGIQFMGDTFDTGVCHMAFFQDPDGNPLMLHHRYAPRVAES